MAKGLNNAQKKALFLEEYKKKACNISATCTACDISRDWYYSNRKKDEKFNKALKNFEEELVDYAETQLYKNIKDGKETSLIFYLKCKAKDRGYVEKQEMDHSVNLKGNLSGNFGVTHNFSNLSASEIKEILGRK